ncbi:MAG: transcription-repair coupling factor, partial [Acidobacteriota bacterium]|nr:transcription-repair coupling factor [Acidobacteriota bacterium]
ALNLGLDLRIPTNYIADENQRLRAYKRIANASDAADREKVEKELEDRYGPVPDEVRNLLEYSGLKTAAEKIGIEAIDRKSNLLNIKFHKETRVDGVKLMELVSKTRDAQFTPAGVLRLPLNGLTDAGAVLAYVKEKLLDPLSVQ